MPNHVLADQMSLASWYPRCNLWETSGLQTGFWTGESEKWYRERRQSILKDKAQPLSGNVWRNRLKFTRATLKLAHQMEKVALDYLDSSQAASFVYPTAGAFHQS